MNALLAMLRTSILSVVRDRQTLTETILFPAILVTAFGAFNLNISGTEFGGDGGTRYLDFVLPGILTLTSVQFAVYWTALAYARLGERNVLRRLRATPMRLRTFLAAQVITRLGIIVLQAAVVVVVASLLGADINGNPLLVVAITAAGAATFLTVGFAIGSIAGNAESANALAGLIVLPLVFLSGAFFPLDGLPFWLERAMAFLPLAPLLDALRTVVIDGGGPVAIAGDMALALAWLPPAFLLAAAAMRSATD